MILGLNTAAYYQNADSNSTTTDSEGPCDEVDDDKLMDQQDHEASSKRRKLEETANTSATVHKSLANFKADFCDTLKQVEQTDSKSSKLEVQEAIKRYPEIVKVSAELVATLSPTQVSVECLFSALRLIRTHQELQWRRNSQKPSCSKEQTIKCTF